MHIDVHQHLYGMLAILINTQCVSNLYAIEQILS